MTQVKHVDVLVAEQVLQLVPQVAHEFGVVEVRATVVDGHDDTQVVPYR